MKCIVGYILLAVCSGAVGAVPIAAAQAANSPPAPQETAPERGATAEPGLPDQIGEPVVITATGEPRPPSDVPAAVTIISRSEIERSPAKTLDELLPSVPSFGLFRRSSSLVADPTSQGLNLRGIGPSGVSRGLMLVDGVPVNDPFGGWIYWSSLPRLGIKQLEIVPGGASALYGSSALGGVVQIVSRRIADEMEAQAEAGAPGTVSFAGLAGHRWGGIAAALEGEFLATDGYFVVPEATRGAIDRHASANHGTVSGRVELAALPWLTLFARGGFFAERQNGGTEFTTGSVNRGEVVLGGTLRTGELSSLDLRLFGHAQRFEQERTRILTDPITGAPRGEEALAARQGVPTQDQGLSLSWATRGLAALGMHGLLLGADLRQIMGRSNEDLLPAPVIPTTVIRRDAGGTQRQAGVFAQDVYDVSESVQFLATARLDLWRNLDGDRFERQSAGATSDTLFPDRTAHHISPRVGLRVRPARLLVLRASAYESFRAPTLNELYRPFQVGTVRTDANENLTPETLRGLEAGVELGSAREWSIRATGFLNRLDDPVTNVTVAPGRQQRQNLGQARIRGAELAARWRLHPALDAAAACSFVDARVTEAATQPQLVGKQLPQDPRFRATVSLTFDDARIGTAYVQLRYQGRQFEDDQNQLPLDSFFVVDVFLSRRLGDHVELLLAADNLLGRSYLVGRQGGIDTLGQPLFVHGGVRLRLE